MDLIISIQLYSCFFAHYFNSTEHTYRKQDWTWKQQMLSRMCVYEDTDCTVVITATLETSTNRIPAKLRPPPWNCAPSFPQPFMLAAFSFHLPFLIVKNEACKACLLSCEIDSQFVVCLDGLWLSPLKNNISHYVFVVGISYFWLVKVISRNKGNYKKNSPIPQHRNYSKTKLW